MKKTFLKSSIVAFIILGNITYAQNIVKNGSFENGPALCDNNGPFYVAQGYVDNWEGFDIMSPTNTAKVVQNMPTCTNSQFYPNISAYEGNRAMSLLLAKTVSQDVDQQISGGFTTGTISQGKYKIHIASKGLVLSNIGLQTNVLQVYLVGHNGSETKKRLIKEMSVPKNDGGSGSWLRSCNSFEISATEAGIYDQVILQLKHSSKTTYISGVYVDNLIIGPLNSTPTPCDGTYDLAAFDNNTDIGSQPYDPGDNWQVWQSNDIWSRATDAGFINGNLVAENVDNANGHNNLVRFRVKNIGVSASKPSHAKLYWTVGTTGGEPWPKAWDGTVIVNGYPVGKEITIAYPTTYSDPNQIPHIGNGNNVTNAPTTYAPGLGFNIPALQPLEEYIVNALWKPSDFGLVDTTYPQICYLARIVDQHDTMYYEPVSSSTFTFSDNVRYNNNIVTRNSTFVPLRGSIGGEPFYRGTGNIFFSNSTQEDNKFDFTVRDVSNSGGTPFSDLGNTLLTLDKDLFDKWVAGGSQAEGIEVTDWEKHELRITDITNAKLKNIALKAGEYRAVALSFELSHDTNIVQDYHFAAFQNLSESPNEEYGTVCNFIVSVNGNQQDPGQPFCESNGNCNDADGSATTAFKGEIKLSPNPSSEMSVLQFTLNNETEINIELLDSFGKIVKTIVKSEKFEKGKQSININISDLNAGIYRVLVYTSSEKKLLNLMKN